MKTTMKTIAQLELNGLSKELINSIIGKLRMLEQRNGWISGSCKEIEGFKPLKQLRVSDCRIFYFIVNEEIQILGIKAKKRKRFPNSVFIEMLKR